MAAMDSTMQTMTEALSILISKGTTVKPAVAAVIRRAITILAQGRHSVLALGEAGTQIATSSLRLMVTKYSAVDLARVPAVSTPLTPGGLFWFVSFAGTAHFVGTVIVVIIVVVVVVVVVDDDDDDDDDRR